MPITTQPFHTDPESLVDIANWLNEVRDRRNRNIHAAHIAWRLWAWRGPFTYDAGLEPALSELTEAGADLDASIVRPVTVYVEQRVHQQRVDGYNRIEIDPWNRHRISAFGGALIYDWQACEWRWRDGEPAPEIETEPLVFFVDVQPRLARRDQGPPHLHFALDDNSWTRHPYAIARVRGMLRQGKNGSYSRVRDANDNKHSLVDRHEWAWAAFDPHGVAWPRATDDAVLARAAALRVGRTTKRRLS